MARAHASGIKVRAGAPAEATSDEPRVVVSVETNPRKVPTHRRLLAAREARADGTRAAALPSAASHPPIASPPRSISRPPQEQEAASARAPLWMRVAFALALVVLAAGVVRRARMWRARAQAAPTAAVAVTVIHEDPPPRVASAAPMAPTPAETEAKAPIATPSAKPVSTAATTVDSAPRRPRPAPPKTTFTPPFQLPGEKAKD